jgi:hypothetical protein
MISILKLDQNSPSLHYVEINLIQQYMEENKTQSLCLFKSKSARTLFVRIVRH